MSLLVLTAAKGAPGVTTAAVALAAVWPGPAILAEADPFGGDVPLWLRDPDRRPLDRGTGILSLAASHPGVDGVRLDDHIQYVAGGLRVLTGPSSPRHAAAIDSSWPTMAQTLAEHDATVIVDCGRLITGTAHTALVRYAALTVLLAPVTVSGLAHARHALDTLGERAATEDRVGVVAVTPARRARTALEEARDALAASHFPVLGWLAYDETGAAGLRGEPTRALDRSDLVCSARTLAAELAVRTTQQAQSKREEEVRRWITRWSSGSATR